MSSSPAEFPYIDMNPPVCVYLWLPLSWLRKMQDRKIQKKCGLPSSLYARLKRVAQRCGGPAGRWARDKILPQNKKENENIAVGPWKPPATTTGSGVVGGVKMLLFTTSSSSFCLSTFYFLCFSCLSYVSSLCFPFSSFDSFPSHCSRTCPCLLTCSFFLHTSYLV